MPLGKKGKALTQTAGTCALFLSFFEEPIMRNTLKSPTKMFCLMSLLGLLLASANLHAKQHLAISLKGTSEMPPVTTAAKGKGKIFVFPNRMVSGSIHYSGLVATMAYIHEAADGENGPPIITLQRTANGSFVVPDDARLTSAQYKSYMAGKLYVNVRSTRHPDGEISARLPRLRTSTRLMRIAY
jgi:hypothetical protein